MESLVLRPFHNPLRHHPTLTNGPVLHKTETLRKAVVLVASEALIKGSERNNSILLSLVNSYMRIISGCSNHNYKDVWIVLYHLPITYTILLYLLVVHSTCHGFLFWGFSLELCKNVAYLYQRMRQEIQIHESMRFVKTNISFNILFIVSEIVMSKT